MRTKIIFPRSGRRAFLKSTGAALGAGALASVAPTRFAIGQQTPIRVGLMLPYSGTYALLGENITIGVQQALDDRGGVIAGRPVEFIRLDDESDPSAASENANRLINRDGADVVIGTVHSGVQMGIVQVVRDTESLLIIPNAGNNEVTRELCSLNVFRSSFSNWQPGYAMGPALAAQGVRRAATLSWDYAAGHNSTDAFREGFEENGGEVVQQLFLPFPDTNWQPLLTQIASLDVEALYVFFAGGGAVQFVRDYAAAGLRDSVQLVGAGFLTDGTLDAQGEAAEGLQTTLHYADGLDTEIDNAFRAGFEERAGRDVDVYAVQGYDAGQMLAIGLGAVEGDVDAMEEIREALVSTEIESPRGMFRLSHAHNPIQDFYLREVRDGRNMMVEVAVEALADPATGCSLA